MATNDERPGCQHQFQFVYEMEVTKDLVDGEIDEFKIDEP